jgi:hypothetical protein
MATTRIGAGPIRGHPERGARQAGSPTVTISKRYLWTAALALVGIAAAVAIAARVALATPPYSARSMLLVAATPPKLIFDTADRASASGPIPEFAMFQKTQVELIKSPRVLGQALSNPEVASLPSMLRRRDPIEWLADGLTLTFVGELLYIELRGDDPQEVVKLVNAVTDAYLEEVVNADKRRREQRLAKLKELSLTLTEKVSQHQRNLKVLAERAGSNDGQTVEYKHQMAMERARRADQDLRSLRIQLRDARIDLATLQAPPQAQPKPKGETTDDVTDKIQLAVAAQRKRIALLEQEEANLVAEAKEFEEGLQSLHRTALSLESPKDEIRFTEKNAEVIGQEVANLEIELNAPSRVNLYQKATVATRR